MRKITTGDGSTTLYSQKFQEHFHTKSGALEEAFKKHANPANIKDGSRILDVCFGIGYNTLAAMQKARNLQIIALENDQDVLDEMWEVEVPELLQKNFSILKKAAKELAYEDEDYKIRILLGDARKTIKQAGKRFDAVFLDPFSPPVCPRLWAAGFMNDIYAAMKKGAILTTYSCARKVRNNLKAAGFIVKDGPIIGRRSPSTIAIKP